MFEGFGYLLRNVLRQLCITLFINATSHSLQVFKIVPGFENINSRTMTEFGDTSNARYNNVCSSFLQFWLKLMWKCHIHTSFVWLFKQGQTHRKVVLWQVYHQLWCTLYTPLIIHVTTKVKLNVKSVHIHTVVLWNCLLYFSNSCQFYPYPGQPGEQVVQLLRSPSLFQSIIGSYWESK